MSDCRNVQFFDTSIECNEALLSMAKVRDQLIVSYGDKDQPLWSDTVSGGIVDIDDEEVALSASPSTKSPRRHHKFDDKEKGYRLDKNWLFYRSASNQDRDTVRACKALQCHPYLIRFTPRPEHQFIQRVRVGDYITVYNSYDEVMPDFLHFQSIGWVMTKNVEEGTVTYINPPNMNPKVYKIQGNEQAFYIFRKIVLQRK